MTTYKGTGTVAVIDNDAQTLTLTHAGMTMASHKKKASPWVIPLGAIEEVEVGPKSFKMPTGSIRLRVRGGLGEAKTINNDLNGILGGSAPVADFADAIESARAGVEPCEMPAEAAAADATVPRKKEKPEQASAQAPAKQREAQQPSTPKAGWLETAQAEREEKLRRKANTFEGIHIGETRITIDGESYPLAGARASVHVGAENKRITATRVVAVGVFALAARKNETRVYLQIDIDDGQQVVVELDRKQEAAARAFASKIINEGTRAAHEQQAAVPPAPAAPTAPPPPPSIPAGWYPDPESAQLQRYWDGTRWTEHTAPLAQ